MNFQVEDGRWLVATAAAGQAGDILALQARLHSPVKAVAPDLWRAEAPVCENAEVIVRDAMRGMIEFQGMDGVPPPSLARAGTSEELPQAAFEGQSWERVPAGFALELDAEGANQHIAASALGSAVLFRSALLRRRIPESARDVLVHFLLALNARLRLARASIADDGVALEVALPIAVLDLFLVEEAVEALTAGFRLARRECACLLDGQVARQYREFHLLKGEEA